MFGHGAASTHAVSAATIAVPAPLGRRMHDDVRQVQVEPAIADHTAHADGLTFGLGAHRKPGVLERQCDGLALAGAEAHRRDQAHVLLDSGEAFNDGARVQHGEASCQACDATAGPRVSRHAPFPQLPPAHVLQRPTVITGRRVPGGVAASGPLAAVPALGRAGLCHQILCGACGDVEDVQDVPVEIPRRPLGFEGRQ